MPEPRGGRKLVERLISKATEAYREGIDEGIWKILEVQWKEEVKHDSETYAEMSLDPDPGNTRGMITQFKKMLYLYWFMKSLLGKAMAQISVSMDITIQGMRSYK